MQWKWKRMQNSHFSKLNIKKKNYIRPTLMLMSKNKNKCIFVSCLSISNSQQLSIAICMKGFSSIYLTFNTFEKKKTSKRLQALLLLIWLSKKNESSSFFFVSLGNVCIWKLKSCHFCCDLWQMTFVLVRQFG